MKNLLLIITLGTIIIAFLSCLKPQEEITPILDKSEGLCSECDTIQMVWFAPIFEDSSFSVPTQLLTYKDKLIYTTRRSNSIEDDRIIMRNGHTGEVIWEWQEAHGQFDSGLSFIVGEELIISSFSNLFSINLATGKTTWETTIENCGNHRMRLINDFIYQSHSACKSNNESTTLARANVHIGKWDTLFTMHRIGGYSPAIESLTHWVNPSGDTVLLFQNRSFNFKELDGKIDLYGWNMKKDSLFLFFEDFDEAGNSSVEQIIVKGDKMYFAGFRTLSCIDLLTGELVWDRYFGGVYEQLLISNFLILDDILVVNGDDHILYGLDPETGSLIWKENNKSFSSSNMVDYNGLVYFTGGFNEIFAVRAQDGKHFWKFGFAKNNGTIYHSGFVGPVNISSELDYIYTLNGNANFLVCLKLPEI